MIDWAQVEQLRQDMGEAFDDLLTIFQDEVDEALDRLAAAADAADIAAASHFLKGAALNLGMAELAALCAGIETRARAGDASGCDPARVRAVFTESRQVLLAGLAQRAA